ncbi:RtcB family protein [Maribellus comscasis]|uniref:3'-phosphate/5'-hydroxy nucleic acid ligase n=1 Tax=Maribellus comscasis TaxID=2681766 RepID=A0A6I6JWQ6_9BACT|nr:RtcB family protein [Maribellus comscasis]QGY42194.1 RtcB family protein [Maribellus comscasis]
MKKIKLRGKELRRIGFTSDQAIALAINLVSRHCSRSDKPEVIDLLERIHLSPRKYIDDQRFGELAKLLVGKPVVKKKKPKLNQAALEFKVYGEENIDPAALEQMTTAMKLPVTIKGALMPDAHVGYGLPIGGVLATYNSVIPYGVGMDIGCRMCLSVFPFSSKKIDSERDRIKKILLNETRFGLAEFNDLEDVEILERKEFKEIKFLKTLQKKFAAQLGTSGHGNHFVDVGFVEISDFSQEIKLQPGSYFAVLSHSGSRNFGSEVCKHYTRIAKDKLELTGEAARLAWLDLDSEEGQEYWAAMQLAGDYSHSNHRIIHKRLAKALGEKPLVLIENHHNFAWKEKLETGEEIVIHRKGATPAGIGDIGIIPGTMASPAFIVSGKGNEDALQSAAHGAGRLMSRNQAKRTFTESQMQKYLQEKGVELLGGGTDESPFAYKNIREVMKNQKDLVNVLGTFHPKIVRME